MIRIHMVRASLCVIVLIASLSAASMSATAQFARPGMSIPVYDPANPWRIVDDARIFDGVAMDRFQYDLRRAQNLGMPIIMYVRRANADAENGKVVADTIRQQWNVETEPGADDGLVMVMTIHPESARGSSLVLSYGVNTFPKRQLTEAIMQQTLEQEMLPDLRKRDYFGALTWGIRRIDYYLDYTPPDPPLLTTTEQKVQGAMTFWAGLLPMVVIISLVVITAWTDRVLTLLPSSTALIRWLNLVVPIIAISALASVIGRSGPGALTSLGCLLAVGISCVIWSRFRPASAASPTPVHVRSRGHRQAMAVERRTGLRHG